MDKKELKFDNALLLCDKISKIMELSKIKNFDFVNDFSNSFMEIYEFEKSKLPYHINILDILWANENAHSRILAELLKQESKKKYEILDSFLEILQVSGEKLKTIRPRITSEKDRIDLLILDKEYAIIIENKIHNAKDQESQIARYIKNVLAKGYEEKQIFVVYLTGNDNKKPEKQSWIYENVDYKERFKERYFPLSFKYDILYWLKNNALHNCKIREVYLKSTIEQYIDYLEGMFNLRKNQYNMNKELQNHIKESLELNSTPEKNLQVLKGKLSEITKVEDQIRNMVLAIETECLKNWLEKLETQFPNYKTIDYSDAKSYRKIGIVLEYEGKAFSVLIELDKNSVYYGIGRHGASQVIISKVKSFSEQFVKEFKSNGWWYGYKYTSMEDGYSSLLSLINKVEKAI